LLNRINRQKFLVAGNAVAKSDVPVLPGQMRSLDDVQKALL